MISVASLLNPASAGLRRTHSSSSPSSTYSTLSSPYGSPLPLRPVAPKLRMAKDGAIFTPGKTKGEVNFPPFESLDEDDMREVEKYQVYPLGQIEECPRHIPYNSDKKSFLEKTGRESFEVFQYEFKLIGEEKTYTVMWDYNIGLVRITPFFKCCKYSKTTPAKMLNLNPGLKEITHSITGGALVAQGYWMPYSCALAVCATFCAHISGALMPIFGPTFPSKCVPTSHQSYSAMNIDPSIITSATAEAESFRQQYSTVSLNSNLMKLNSASPRELLQEVEHLSLHSPADLSHRLRLKRTFTNASIYTTDAETSDTSMSSRDRYPCSPITPTSSHNGHGWTPDNIYPTPTHKRAGLRTTLPSFIRGPPLSHGPHHSPSPNHSHGHGHRPTLSCGASPWLSAIPRSIADASETASTIKAPFAIKSPSPTLRRSMRRTVDAERAFDEEYDGEESGSGSGSERSGHSDGGQSEGSEGMEKKAAWLLMNLSVRDGAWGAAGTSTDTDTGIGTAVTNIGGTLGSGEAREQLIVESPDAPRVKRRRALSL